MSQDVQSKPVKATNLMRRVIIYLCPAARRLPAWLHPHVVEVP